jgi:uncharacterized protein YbjT (DUF2867 family)
VRRYQQGCAVLKHLLIDVIGHVSGLSDAQLEQIEQSLPATKALIDLLNKAHPIIEQAQTLYNEAQPLIEQARKEWQTVGPAAQILIDVISHHLNKGSSPAEATEAVRAALSGSIMNVAEGREMDRGMNCVTVFGGTGFVGRRVVCHLSDSTATVRIAARHPARAEGDNVERIIADAHDERSVEAAVVGADGVVNAISLYVEHGVDTFHSVHVEAAARIARVAKRAGVKRFVHLSGIGADAASPSPYIRNRGEGEAAVQAAFPGAVVVRPAVMFALDDAFLTTILGLLRTLPAYPLFGDGRTRLQPVYVDDVAAAIAQILRQPQRPYPVYELAGPRIYSYGELCGPLRIPQDCGRCWCEYPLLSGMPSPASLISCRTRRSRAIRLSLCRSTRRPRTAGRDLAYSEFRRDRSKKNSKRCASTQKRKLKTKETLAPSRG